MSALIDRMAYWDLTIDCLLKESTPLAEEVAEAIGQGRAIAREAVECVNPPFETGGFLIKLHRLEYRFLGNITAARGGNPEQLFAEAMLAAAEMLDAAPKKRPGPPKGRLSKIRYGGDWTPQLLKAELSRLDLSETRLAKLLGINQKSVNKWCRNAIPDERQGQITEVLTQYENDKKVSADPG
jgi:hypothetical protein